jgi:hypothetical protein
MGWPDSPGQSCPSPVLPANLVDESPKQPSQMTLVHYDDVVQQRSAQGPDHAFRGFFRRGRYLDTVASEMLMPNFSSSP